MTHAMRLVFTLLLAAAAPAASSAPVSPAASPKERSFDNRMEGMRFRCIGPFRGGRVTAVAGVRGQRNVHYFGGTGGGVWKTADGGTTWSSIDNQPTGQFYRVAVDDRFPYRAYGAQQDNSTVAIASRARGGAIGREEWHSVGGCESGWIAPKPGEPDVVYAGCYGGSITRYDQRTGLPQTSRGRPRSSPKRRRRSRAASSPPSRSW